MKRTVSLPECPESWHKESDYGAFIFYLKYLLRCCGHKSNQITSTCEKSVRFCEKSRKEKYLYETEKKMWSWQDTSFSNTRRGGIAAWAPVHLPADLASWVRTMELSCLIWMFYSVRKARLKKIQYTETTCKGLSFLHDFIPCLLQQLYGRPSFHLSVDPASAPLLACLHSFILVPSA